jgi:hypothetical protein
MIFAVSFKVKFQSTLMSLKRNNSNLSVKFIKHVYTTTYMYGFVGWRPIFL